MQRLAFILSGILAIAGVLLLALGQLWDALLPVISRMAFLLAKSGSYSPSDYQAELSNYYTTSILCIIIGLVLCITFYRHKAQR